MNDHILENAIGIVNLGIIIANGKGEDFVKIDKITALQISVFLETLKCMKNILYKNEEKEK